MLMEELRFHHIGIACHDIEVTKGFYVAQGYVASETVDDARQHVRICFLTKSGMPQLELVAPLDGVSPVLRTLETSGVAPYHICYEVDDIAAAIKELKALHFVLVSRPVAACAIDDRRVCFLYSKDAGLIELVEK